MHPTSVNSHRAFMVITMTLAACLAFGLAAGWQWYFKEIGIRQRLQEIEDNSQRRSPAAVPSFDREEPRAETTPTRPAEPNESTSLSLVDTRPQRIDRDERIGVPSANEVIVLNDESTPALIQQAERIVQSYFATPSWQDRLGLVWNQDHCRTLMEDYYERQGGRDPDPGALQNTGRFRVNGMEILHLSYASDRPLGSLEMALRKDTSGDWKIDWESFVGYSEMSWADLASKRPTTPTLLRVYVKMGDYYNYEFSDSSQFLSVRILSADGESLIHGFCKRGTDLANFLTTELSMSTDQAKGYTVRIAYPENAESDNCAWLTEVVSPRWLLGPGEQ